MDPAAIATTVATSPIVDTVTLVLLGTQLVKPYIPGDANNTRSAAALIGVLVYVIAACVQPDAVVNGALLFTAAAQGLIVGATTTFTVAGVKAAPASLPRLSVQKPQATAPVEATTPAAQ